MDVDRAVGEVLREVGDVLGLAIGQPAGTQLRPGFLEDPLRGHVADAGGKAVPYALRRLDRDLLADDRACQRQEGLAAAREEDPGMRAHDVAHHRIAPRERALGAIPVLRLHSTAG
jgi:hypothetical protein